MIKWIVLMMMSVAGFAAAQPAATGSAAPAAGSAAPATGSAAPAAGSAAPAAAGSAAPADAATTASAGEPARSPDELRKICAAAMNADPTFAKAIELTVDRQIDQKTIDAHEDAFHHIQKNERHVIYAYAAMWVIAALFVIFLWRRQRVLSAEIEQLRRDLEAAAKENA